MIVDESHPKTGLIFVQVLVKPLVNLIWVAGHRLPVRVADRAVAGRARAAAARRATRPRDVVIIVGVLLAAVVVVLVALPFLREPVAADDRLDAPTEAEERRLALVEERDRALAALKELEFDHRTGKVDDADYRELVGPLRQAAAAALRALDSPQE